MSKGVSLSRFSVLENSKLTYTRVLLGYFMGKTLLKHAEKKNRRADDSTLFFCVGPGVGVSSKALYVV